MRFRLMQYTEDLFSTLWLLPVIISLLLAALSIFLALVDQELAAQNMRPLSNPILGDSSTQTILTIIASATVTITSVIFSITILILSIASSQLSPRLLPNFMRQNVTQTVLGVFIGTFIYTLITLTLLGMNKNADLSLNVIGGIGLGITCFLFLIYFIHYVANAIQINNVLTFLLDDISRCVSRQLNRNKNPSATIYEKTANEYEKEILQNNPYNYKCKIQIKESGYIQTIDTKQIFSITAGTKALIKIECTPGTFVAEDEVIMTIYTHEALSDSIQRKLTNTVKIGQNRTTIQDITYGYEEIAEIAIRALSPGVNDPYTAVYCINALTQGLKILSQHQTAKRSSQKDGVTLLINWPHYRDIVETSLSRLRQQAEDDFTVTLSFLSSITKITKMNIPTELHHALSHEAELLYEKAVEKQYQQSDIQKIHATFKKIRIIDTVAYT